MYEWGPRSKKVRLELDSDLRMLFDIVLELSPFDISLSNGHRNQHMQDAAFASGASQVEWPDSKHNSLPSMAGHIDPLPIHYENVLRYYVLAGVVFAAASRLGIDDRIRWGGLWDRPWLPGLEDNPFKDLAHWEILEVVE